MMGCLTWTPGRGKPDRLNASFGLAARIAANDASRMWHSFRFESDLSSTDDEYPLGGVFDMVAWGVVLAAVPLLPGVIGLMTLEMPWPLEDAHWRGEGESVSAAFCLILIGIGLFLHFHYFWGILHARLPFMLGRKGSLLLCAGALACIAVSFARSWFIALG